MNPDPDKIEARKESQNPDPLTGEPGSHPVATGVGAAAVGAAGLAAAAAVAGPVGVAAATIGGAVIGAYVGKAAGEAIDPTSEEAYWREEHVRQPFAAGVPFDEYRDAYRHGFESYDRFGGPERTFEDAEPELRAEYESRKNKMAWTQARPASRAAWERVHRGEARRIPIKSGQGMTEAVSSENAQTGALSNAQMPR